MNKRLVYFWLKVKMEYTIASTDAEHFNRIHVNLPLPSWKYSNVMITSFVANCNMLILKKGDYINLTLDDQNYKLTINANITSMSNAATFIATLPSISNSSDIPIEFNVNTDERITITASKPFTITDMSYNMKLVLGLYYDVSFPIIGVKNNDTNYYYNIQAVGYFLSTPVLYLLSNLGGVNYFNRSDESYKIDANSISMRMLNSFTASMPIVSSNSEFSKITLSTDLTDFEIIMVDANLHEVEMLNPVYVTINISNASESMTLEDMEKYEYTRKTNTEQELIRQQMLKVKFATINKEMDKEFNERFERLNN